MHTSSTARLLLLVAIGAGGVASSEGAAAAPAPVEKTQELAVLIQPQTARSRPAADAPKLALVRTPRPLTNARTQLPVIDHAFDAGGDAWLRVMLPGRPNGLTGWIRRRGTLSGATPWHVVVNTSTRRATVFRSGRALRSFSVIVGTRSTPTPQGEFFVEEALRLRASEPGAPYALALSSRSEVLQEFAGGPGQIALHGRGNLGGRLGSAASHGCVRLSTPAITWLAKRVGAGVPVTVTRSGRRSG